MAKRKTHPSKAPTKKRTKEIQVNDHVQATQGGETETNPPQVNQTETNPSHFEPQGNKGGDDDTSESSTSDTGSSDENIVDPFVLLKL